MIKRNRQVFWLMSHHFTAPSRFPSGFAEQLVNYSGGTAWDFNPLPF
jgi:hypothetical protein